MRRVAAFAGSMGMFGLASLTLLAQEVPEGSVGGAPPLDLSRKVVSALARQIRMFQQVGPLSSDAEITTTFSDHYISHYDRILPADSPARRSISLLLDGVKYRLALTGETQPGQQELGNFVESFDGRVRQTFDGRDNVLIVSTKLLTPEAFFFSWEGLTKPYMFLSRNSTPYTQVPLLGSAHTPESVNKFLQSLALKSQSQHYATFKLAQSDDVHYEIDVEIESGFPLGFRIYNSRGDLIMTFAVVQQAEQDGWVYPVESKMQLFDPEGKHLLRTDVWKLKSMEFKDEVKPDRWYIDPSWADKIWDKDNDVWINNDNENPH